MKNKVYKICCIVLAFLTAACCFACSNNKNKIFDGKYVSASEEKAQELLLRIQDGITLEQQESSFSINGYELDCEMEIEAESGGEYNLLYIKEHDLVNYVAGDETKPNAKCDIESQSVLRRGGKRMKRSGVMYIDDENLYIKHNSGVKVKTSLSDYFEDYLDDYIDYISVTKIAHSLASVDMMEFKSSGGNISVDEADELTKIKFTTNNYKYAAIALRGEEIAGDVTSMLNSTGANIDKCDWEAIVILNSQNQLHAIYCNVYLEISLLVEGKRQSASAKAESQIYVTDKKLEMPKDLTNYDDVTKSEFDDVFGNVTSLF